jgi:hypothetical protein
MKTDGANAFAGVAGRIVGNEYGATRRIDAVALRLRQRALVRRHSARRSLSFSFVVLVVIVDDEDDNDW